eukprot:6479054-Amphidinium_carterae.1
MSSLDAACSIRCLPNCMSLRSCMRARHAVRFGTLSIRNDITISDPKTITVSWVSFMWPHVRIVCSLRKNCKDLKHVSDCRLAVTTGSSKLTLEVKGAQVSKLVIHQSRAVSRKF